ncbi:MAG TPA: hypothetical protein PK847_13780 [Candidatus Sumerlaeota bacterium]|nr:hypothetical protein [Candidatus Sumerlaeota bacterium]
MTRLTISSKMIRSVATPSRPGSRPACESSASSIRSFSSACSAWVVTWMFP